MLKVEKIFVTWYTLVAALVIVASVTTVLFATEPSALGTALISVAVFAMYYFCIFHKMDLEERWWRVLWCCASAMVLGLTFAVIDVLNRIVSTTTLYVIVLAAVPLAGFSLGVVITALHSVQAMWARLFVRENAAYSATGHSVTILGAFVSGLISSTWFKCFAGTRPFSVYNPTSELSLVELNAALYFLLFLAGADVSERVLSLANRRVPPYLIEHGRRLVMKQQAASFVLPVLVGLVVVAGLISLPPTARSLEAILPDAFAQWVSTRVG